MYDLNEPAVNRTLLSLSPLERKLLLRSVLGKTDTQTTLEPGELLLLWLALTLKSLPELREAEQRLILEELVVTIQEHGKRVQLALATESGTLPVASLSVGGKRWVRCSGRSQFLDLRSAGWVERPDVPPILHSVIDLTALYVTGYRQIEKARQECPR